MAFELPQVIDDFDSACISIDAAIRVVAARSAFHYTRDVQKFVEVGVIPKVIYSLIRHYTERGFLCEYDGVEGKLKISWAYPNMTYLEHKQITRATPEFIEHLGVGFRASQIYLCITSNNDLRKHNDQTMMRDLQRAINDAALLGNNDIWFGFPDVSPEAFYNLFEQTFVKLEEAGFKVTYDQTRNAFRLRWGQTFGFGLSTGAHATLDDEPTPPEPEVPSEPEGELP